MNRLNRRTLLIGVASTSAVGVSGCLGDAANGDPGENGSDDENGDPEGDGSDAESGGNDDPNEDSVEMTLSIDDLDNDPDPLAFDLELIDDQFTESTFPTLEITVENVGDETAKWGYGGSVLDLPVPQGKGSEPSGLVIGRDGNIEAQLMDIDEGCARVEYFDRDDGFVEVTLDPGENIGETYGISGIASSLETECPPSGTYSFEFEYGDHGSWGFEVDLE